VRQVEGLDDGADIAAQRRDQVVPELAPGMEDDEAVEGQGGGNARDTYQGGALGIAQS
jgi:hypothetical protein